ncbi:hypothetical protein PSEUDO8O_170048 [Pseudomonas sp. 8O]|nr:hypothetical protein PSEUDO8O_170048 [Pseudomonas sp. 8O]
MRHKLRSRMKTWLYDASDPRRDTLASAKKGSNLKQANVTEDDSCEESTSQRYWPLRFSTLLKTARPPVCSAA